MKVGDRVKMSDKNLNHLGTSTCAYSGMEGVVTDIWDDNSFAIRGETSVLVVPMNESYKKPKEGVWIYLNGELVFHKRRDPNFRRILISPLNNGWVIAELQEFKRRFFLSKKKWMTVEQTTKYTQSPLKDSTLWRWIQEDPMITIVNNTNYKINTDEKTDS